LAASSNWRKLDAEQEFHAFSFQGAEFVAEFLEAVVGFFVGFEGEHVDGFHSFHPFLEQADLGLEGGEIFVGLRFGWKFGEFGGKFGALGGDLDDEVVHFGLALLLELGKFLLFPLEFLEVELELAEFGFGFVAILFVGAKFFVEDN
jgi:hypothetical protein